MGKMSIEVEWQIIEGEGRKAETIIAPPPPRPKRRLPKWVFALAAFPLVAAAIVGGYMAWVYRVQLGRATREVSIIAKAEARAVAAGDQQSFMALQDPDDPVWRALQERHFGRLERLGIPEFSLAPTGALPQPGDVTLEPGGARLDMLRQFSVTQPMPGGPAVITLRVPQFYRQTPSGWVRAQPSAEFWGSRRTITGKHVLALYSRRDADIVESLIPQLDQVLEKACVNLKCPSQTTLTFETSQDAAGYGGISTYNFGEGSLTIKFASPGPPPRPGLGRLPADHTLASGAGGTVRAIYHAGHDRHAHHGDTKRHAAALEQRRAPNALDRRRQIVWRDNGAAGVCVHRRAVGRRLARQAHPSAGDERHIGAGHSHDVAQGGLAGVCASAGRHDSSSRNSPARPA
jgi:hypothetical protein